MDVIEELDKQIKRNEELLAKLNSETLSADPNDLTEDKIREICKESIAEISKTQLLFGLEVTTKIEKVVDSKPRGWLEVYDSNLTTALQRLPPSSVIAIMLNSPTGKNFVFSFMAELVKPIYVFSSSMDHTQIMEMMASKVITPAIYLDLKGKIDTAERIDEFNGSIPIPDRSVVFIFIESPQLNGKEIDYGTIDVFKKRFTPKNGYLFIVVEANYFSGSYGESLLSYISSTSVNTMIYREESGAKLLELTGFYSSKIHQLKIIDDITIRTKFMGRGFFVQ